MGSLYLSQDNVSAGILNKFKAIQFLLRKKLEQYREIHWVLKIPALGIIVIYLLFLPTVILADKIKIVINLALILALVSCAFVYGRSTGLQDGALIGMIEGIDQYEKWDFDRLHKNSSPRPIGGTETEIKSYLIMQQSNISKNHPVLQQQVLYTFNTSIMKWSDNNKKEKEKRSK